MRELARSPLLALERSDDVYVYAPYKPSLIEVAFLIAVRLKIAWYNWLSKSNWLEVMEKISKVIELKTSSNNLHTRSVSKHSVVSDWIPFLLVALMKCLDKKTASKLLKRDDRCALFLISSVYSFIVSAHYARIVAMCCVMKALPFWTHHKWLKDAGFNLPAGKGARIHSWCTSNSQFFITSCHESLDRWVACFYLHLAFWNRIFSNRPC